MLAKGRRHPPHRGIVGEFTARNDGYLHGPPGQWIEELLPSILEDGVGTFILATDHQPTLQRFAAEVIPALRAAVDAARGSSQGRSGGQAIAGPHAEPVRLAAPRRPGA